MAHRVALLREDPDDLDSASRVRRDVGGKLTEPVAALWSPGAAVEIQQEAAAREEFPERPHPPFLIAQRKLRRARQR
jgi:hypothetical protein